MDRVGAPLGLAFRAFSKGPAVTWQSPQNQEKENKQRPWRLMVVVENFQIVVSMPMKRDRRTDLGSTSNNSQLVRIVIIAVWSLSSLMRISPTVP